MTTLHIVSAQLDDLTLQSLERSLGDADGIIFTCDAVYLALKPGFAWKTEAVYALTPDVQARGLEAHWPRDIGLVDHTGLVELCMHFDKSLSWS